MKKVVSIILMLALLIPTFAVRTSAVENEVTVTLNGFKIVFDVPGRIIGDRTMVPLRMIFQVLGADVEWIGETREIISTYGDDTIKLAIGSKELYKNGEMIYTLDVPPVIVEENGESRTLVPVRAISESLGFAVKWDPDTATAMIYDFRDAEVEDSTFARRLIGSMPIDYDTYTYFRSYASKELGAGSSEFLENEENKTLLEETADEYLKYYYSVLHLAASLGMSKYDPEVINTVNSAFEEYKSFYGPAFDEVLAENGMTEKLFKDLLYSSLFEKEIFDGYSVIASEMTAEQKTKELLQDPSLIRVSHILVDSREAAESLLEEAKSASDDEFYEMTQEYGKDNGMENNKDGYYFTPDHMLPEFEAAAYSLEIGETSDIVKSKYGYHIIRRLPLDIDYISRNTDGLYVLKAESDYYSMIDQLSDILVIHKFDE